MCPSVDLSVFVFLLLFYIASVNQGAVSWDVCLIAILSFLNIFVRLSDSVWQIVSLSLIAPPFPSRVMIILLLCLITDI